MIKDSNVVFDREFQKGSTMNILVLEHFFAMIWKTIEQIDEFEKRRTAG